MMKIIITGASGFIGSALLSFLQSLGHSVTSLSRKRDKGKIYWDPEKGECDPGDFEKCDVVINLAGENIAGFWTEKKKQKILESRVKSTRTLCKAFSQCENPPKLLINASAMGYYGTQGENVVTEGNPKGNGFLSDVCQQWETAAREASKYGVRVICLRTSMVLSSKGGSLAKMLLPFQLGFGGIFGSGKQYMSWVALEDFLGIIAFLLENPRRIEGSVNVCSPYPVTNREFTKILGRVLHRPTFLPVPERGLQLIFGQMGDEILLGSLRMVPQKLIESGYTFLWPHLEEALSHEVGS